MNVRGGVMNFNISTGNLKLNGIVSFGETAKLFISSFMINAETRKVPVKVSKTNMRWKKSRK